MPRHPPCALSRLAAEISNSRSAIDKPKRAINHTANQRFRRSTANDNYTQRILKQSNTLEPTPIRLNGSKINPKTLFKNFHPTGSHTTNRKPKQGTDPQRQPERCALLKMPSTKQPNCQTSIICHPLRGGKPAGRSQPKYQTTPYRALGLRISSTLTANRTNFLRCSERIKLLLTRLRSSNLAPDSQLIPPQTTQKGPTNLRHSLTISRRVGDCNELFPSASSVININFFFRPAYVAIHELLWQISSLTEIPRLRVGKNRSELKSPPHEKIGAPM